MSGLYKPRVPLKYLQNWGPVTYSFTITLSGFINLNALAMRIAEDISSRVPNPFDDYDETKSLAILLERPNMAFIRDEMYAIEAVGRKWDRTHGWKLLRLHLVEKQETGYKELVLIFTPITFADMVM